MVKTYTLQFWMSARYFSRGSFIMLFLLFPVFQSCKPSTEKKILQITENIMSQEVRIDTASMNKLKTADWEKYIKKNTRFKILSYVSRQDCTDCFLNHVCLWEVFLAEIEERHLPVEFFFIFEDGDDYEKKISRELSGSPVADSSWIDVNCLFRKQNPFIPQEDLFHTFLLDQDNRIMLVGNPIESDELKSLYLKTVQD